MSLSSRDWYFMTTCPYFWWHILYITNHYSVQIPPCFDLFSISTTSSWPSLYTLVTFMALYVYLLLLGELMFTWVIFYDYMGKKPLVTYSVHLPPLIDLFCTYGTCLFYTQTTPCWPILSKYYLFLTLYVLFCWFIPLWWAFFCIFYGYICTYIWWPILYTYLFLVTYFVH